MRRSRVTRRNAAICALVAAALAAAVTAASTPSAITGVIVDAVPSDAPLAVLVHGRSVHTAVGVSQPRPGAPATFTLPATLPAGDYVLELSGARRLDYPHVRASIADGGRLLSVEARRDPLLMPGGVARNETDVMLRFEPVGPAAFGEPPRQSWALVRMLNRPFVLFQLISGAFVLWFPRYIASIDPDMVYELTGETPPDIGDPNKLLKLLLSRSDGGNAVGDGGVDAVDGIHAVAES
jgi:hypothetical protein